jgi:hypothetical protein
MSSMLIALVLKPIVMPLFFAAIVIPIELGLRRIWPDGPIKRLLFARNYDKHHPVLFTVAWFVLMALMIGAVSAYVA